jgi:hypothetical protein
MGEDGKGKGVESVSGSLTQSPVLNQEQGRDNASSLSFVNQAMKLILKILFQGQSRWREITFSIRRLGW